MRSLTSGEPGLMVSYLSLERGDEWGSHLLWPELGRPPLLTDLNNQFHFGRHRLIVHSGRTESIFADRIDYRSI